jgi:deoxyribodipyrimidine photolyase-related protein
MELLLFPNQLFEVDFLKGYEIEKVYFVEHPLFYGKRRGSGAVGSLKLNPVRLAFMARLHKEYVAHLQKYFPVSVVSGLPARLEKPMAFDPCDLLLLKELQKKKVRVFESPSFLLSSTDITEYRLLQEGKKRLVHGVFYEFVKKKLGILEGVKSFDPVNRTPYSKNFPLPAATDYLEKLPLTTTAVRGWLKDFFKHRFAFYGTYQDIIHDQDALLYHSGLSIYLNNGMITPKEVIDMALAQKTGMNNIEGFVRQIAGWREYSRYYYLTVGPSVYKKNPFHNTKKLDAALYKGTTPIPLVNKTIAYAWQYGYLNHIQRLMVMSNYMTLAGYSPDAIYQWMFEFSLDAYEWVMVFNCYSMGSWSDEGYAMRKPYVSSSNYLVKMSNEGRGNWTEAWDEMFRKFVQRNMEVLSHTVLANFVK